MLKMFRAVTALLVTLALAAVASAQPIGAPYGPAPVQDLPLDVTTTTAGAQTLWTKPTGGYTSFNSQFTSIGSGATFTFEGSMDGSNWVAINCTNNATAVATVFAPLTGTVYTCPLNQRYVRSRLTAFTSGTLTLKGVFRMTPWGAVAPQVGSPGDAQIAYQALFVRNWNAGLGTTGWEDIRTGADVTVLASAARTTTTASSDQVNYNRAGMAHVVINVSAIGAAPSITCTIQGKDGVSSAYYTVLASAAITTVSTTVLRVGRGLTAAANTVANDFLPRTWRVNCVHANGDSITYSIGASLLVG
jgi:hypothetical protein